MQDPYELPAATLRAPSYYLLSARTECPYCSEPTRVFALALPPNHQWLHMDDDSEVADVWQGASGVAVLFHIEALSPAVASQLGRLAPGFRLAPGASMWMNHCDHCREAVEDDELHAEPEDAFMPLSDAAAGAIQLTEVHEPLQACATGYAADSTWVAHSFRA